ncbi:MAG: hypothetical protein ABIF71_10125 [Planctomycetota bacterium]
MNRLLVTLIVLAFVLTLGAPLMAADKDKKVTASGVGDNTPKGREDAKNAAIRAAIEKAVGTYITADIQVQNKQVIDEKIYSHNEAYVKDVTVLSAGPNKDGLWEVRIEAVVAEGKLKDDMRAFEFLKKSTGNPRLMVIAKVTERNEHWYSNPDVDSMRAKIENRLLKGKFKVVDMKQVQNVQDVDKAAAGGDAAQLKALAQRYGAEIIVTSSMVKNLTDTKSIYGRETRFFSVEIQMSAVIADTAQLIYSDAIAEPRIGEANIPPLYEKLTNLTKEMIDAITAQWQADVFNAAAYEITVTNADYNNLQLFKEALAYSLGINDVIERSFAENVAMIEVAFAGSADQLGMLLNELAEPKVKVASRTANKFKVEFGPGAPPPPPKDTTPPVINITAPANNAMVGKAGANCTVTGTVDDPAVTSVMVNGTAAAVANGAWSAVVTLASGVNTIAATATDPAGNAGQAQVTVTLDDKPPFLKFKIIDLEAKTFSGQAEPGSKLTMNGKPLAVDANGFFKVQLDGGFKGVLKFDATDAAGNTNSKSFEIAEI